MDNNNKFYKCPCCDTHIEYDTTEEMLNNWHDHSVAHILSINNGDGGLVDQYLGGKEVVLNRLLGGVMKYMEHKGQPDKIRTLLTEHLEVWRKYL